MLPLHRKVRRAQHDLQNNVVCGACQPPSRAGKTKKAAAAQKATQEAALVEVSIENDESDLQEELQQAALANVAAMQPPRPGPVARAD